MYYFLLNLSFKLIKLGNEENLEDKKEEEMDSLSLLKLTTAQSFIDSLIFDLLTKG